MAHAFDKWPIGIKLAFSWPATFLALRQAENGGPSSRGLIACRTASSAGGWLQYLYAVAYQKCLTTPLWAHMHEETRQQRV